MIMNSRAKQRYKAAYAAMCGDFRQWDRLGMPEPKSMADIDAAMVAAFHDMADEEVMADRHSLIADGY